MCRVNETIDIYLEERIQIAEVEFPNLGSLKRFEVALYTSV